MRTVLATLHSKYIHASLALPCLAAFCHDLPGERRILEFTVHEPRESLLATLLAADPEVVAFSVYLWNRGETLALIDALAAARPGLRLVVGGPEVSFDGPELFTRHPGLTARIRGEGELPLRALLAAWAAGEEPVGIPRLDLRSGATLRCGPDGPVLDPLDALPSPFALGLVDLSRGFTYLETSRGCPYRCSFCLSARDQTVRSFAPERIRSDLALLLEREVAKIKLVDRTFNYDPARARELFAFILGCNRRSHFHFEIGAHLLDGPTLALLAAVPEGMFQFEIGVQSTLPETLAAIDRRVDLERGLENVARLRRAGNIRLHLDLIAGLPGEDYATILNSVERVMALAPHHLQIEPVKVLPGSPLRDAAGSLGLRHDPNPPYTAFASPELEFDEFERLRGISRLLDLTWNAERLTGLLPALAARSGGFAPALERLDAWWRQRGLYRQPLAQSALFAELHAFLAAAFSDADRQQLCEHLARDHALAERIVAGAAPAYFDQSLTPAEQAQVASRTTILRREAHRAGVKFQHFAAVFQRLSPGREVRLFLYRTTSGRGLEIREERLG